MFGKENIHCLTTKNIKINTKNFFSFILDKVLAAVNNKRNQLENQRNKAKQSMTSSGSNKTKYINSR